MPSTDRKLELQANGIDVSAQLAAVCVYDGPNEATRLAAVGVCERVNDVNIYYCSCICFGVVVDCM
jgi:uncharacterized protein YraI